jgi:hypothetical protein
VLVPGIQLDEIAEPARAAWMSLRDQLRTILGEDLAAMWAYGGSTSVGDPTHGGDLDTYILVSRRPDQTVVRRLEEAEQGLARERGIEWDTWYVLADDARGTDPPRHAWREGRRDTSWAINRAHWLAGRYVALHGPEPDAIVRPPSWNELQGELSRELEHIERHVLEGDTDPYEATYALLNGSRILHALETRNVALSKRAAGQWALEHLPARWHPGLEAALRSYDGHGTAGTIDLLAMEVAPFVAFVRERLPYPEDRPSDAPRWSGS